MADKELAKLLEDNSIDSTNAIDVPSRSTLAYLGRLDLDDDAIEILLGDSPGLSWIDIRANLTDFYHRLRRRTSYLICHDDELKESVSKALDVGADAVWLTVIGAFGIRAETLAASALKPIAIAIMKSGVGKLCEAY